MSSEIFVALCSLAGTLIGSLFGVWQSSKLTIYRLEQLENAVHKYSNVIERTYKLEGRMTEVEHDITELKNRRAS